MTRPGLRLLAVTILALVVGFVAGLRAATTFGGHHRWMAPPLSANLALYELPQSSAGLPGPVAAPADRHVRLVTAVQAASAQAGQPGIQAAPAQAGRASWHATGRDGFYAAAGPALRAALGPTWRGAIVTVCRGGDCLTVTLNDFCRCDTAEPHKLIDLSDEAFALFAPLERGVVEVEVRP